jgi:hypothetical protein
VDSLDSSMSGKIDDPRRRAWVQILYSRYLGKSYDGGKMKTMRSNRQASDDEGRYNGASVPHEAISLMLPLPPGTGSLEKPYALISGRRSRI